MFSLAPGRYVVDRRELLKARLKLGLTQTELGIMLGVSKVYVCRLERGDYATVSLTRARELCKIFKWDMPKV